MACIRFCAELTAGLNGVMHHKQRIAGGLQVAQCHEQPDRSKLHARSARRRDNGFTR